MECLGQQSASVHIHGEITHEAFRPEPSIPAQTIIFALIRDSGLQHHSPQFDRQVNITSAGCSVMTMTRFRQLITQLPLVVCTLVNI